MQPPFNLQVTIQSDTRYLAPLRQMVDALAKVVGERRFPRRAKEAVSLSLIEAVDNAIFHAHRKQIDLPIDVVLSVGDRYVRADVGDRGKGLNHPAISAPSLTSTRGRGLFLINSMMNKVVSEKNGDIHWIRMTYYL